MSIDVHNLIFVLKLEQKMSNIILVCASWTPIRNLRHAMQSRENIMATDRYVRTILKIRLAVYLNNYDCSLAPISQINETKLIVPNFQLIKSNY